jgi:hypothetical protein
MKKTLALGLAALILLALAAVALADNPAPTVLTPKEGDKVGTRIDFSITTTPGVLQVIWTVVKNADTGEVLSTVPGIRHYPKDDGTYAGGIAAPHVDFGDKTVAIKYELHFRNGPNDGDPQTVVNVLPGG